MDHRRFTPPLDEAALQRELEARLTPLIAHLHAYPGWQEPALVTGLLAALTALGCRERFILRTATLCLATDSLGETLRWQGVVTRLQLCSPYDEPVHRITHARLQRS